MGETPESKGICNFLKGEHLTHFVFFNGDAKFDVRTSTCRRITKEVPVEFNKGIDVLKIPAGDFENDLSERRMVLQKCKFPDGQ